MKNIELEKAEIIRKYGEWTKHDIKLSDGIYSMKDRTSLPRLKKFVQLVSNVAQVDFTKLRILDIASLEGQFAIEFALQGAQVVGIEGREANIQKAIFAKNVLGLNNLEFYQDDVRNISKEKYGEFDIILCAGILYHLDFPDPFVLLEKIHEMCKKFAIIDTHITFQPTLKVKYKDFDYLGWSYGEHSPHSTQEQKLELKEASLDNVTSFWPTKPSLINFLTRTGFSSCECINIRLVGALEANDRIELIAFKNKPLEIKSSPVTNDYQEMDMDEHGEVKDKKLEQEILIYREFVNNLTSTIGPTLQKLENLKKY